MRKLETLNIRSIKHLCIHLGCRKSELSKFCAHPGRYYHQFPLDVKGKVRPIAAPVGRLREILYKLKILLDRICLPYWMQGGVKGCSPKTNASCHIGKPAVLNFDIESFFPSIKPHYVYRLFNKRMGCSRDVSNILTCLVTLNGELPQGSPTSTVVANLIILPLAGRMKILADKHTCDYGQFVDDGNISGPAYIENLRPLIDRIIQQEGFRASPKPHKRKTMYQSNEQVVTGIKVNKRIDVPSPKFEEVKDDLRKLNMKIRSGIELSDSEVASVKGKVQFVATLNPKKAHRLRSRLSRILKRAS